MKLINFYERLKKLGQIIVRTQDIAVLFQISLSHASKLLNRLTEAGLLVHVSGGLWGFKDQIDPLLLPNYVTAPYPSYISLQTALYYHNMIDQIPSVIYAVSLSRTRVVKTPIAVLSIHHISPDFYCGYSYDEKSGITMATPEKAMIDYFYYRTAKSKLFRTLPEIELPENFDLKNAKSYIDKIHSKSRQKVVLNQFNQLIVLQKRSTWQ